MFIILINLSPPKSYNSKLRVTTTRFGFLYYYLMIALLDDHDRRLVSRSQYPIPKLLKKKNEKINKNDNNEKLDTDVR